MSGRKKMLLTLLAVIVLVVAVCAFLVWRYPLSIAVWLERRALGKAGFRKAALATSAGKLVFWEAGSGQPLIFLHGAGDHAGAWSQVAGEFSRDYSVILLDFPGHGESEPREGALSMGLMVAGLDALVQDRSPNRPVILVGNSMGGWVAMLYAHQHPERVARVVAVNGGALRGSESPAILLPADREAARHLMSMLRDPGSPPLPGFVLDDLVRTARSGPLGRLMASGADWERYVLDGRLHELKTPVNLLWGGSDKYVPLPYAGRLQFEIPAARLDILDRCGHVPQRECPRAFQAELRKILSMPPPEPCPKCGAENPAAKGRGGMESAPATDRSKP
jgi:pimeloyl-ACP methyl ester carboxylesterase